MICRKNKKKVKDVLDDNLNILYNYRYILIKLKMS